MAVRSRKSTKPKIEQRALDSQNTPQKSKKRKNATYRLKLGLKAVLLIAFVLLTLYAMCPFILRYSHFIQKELIYVNRFTIPFFANLSAPEEFGLRRARHFYLEHDNGCKIGVWQILPRAYHNEPLSLEDFPAFLSDNRPVVLYLHGNTGTRATFARVEVYRLLSEQKGYHVVTFDYKGFGDSDCSPSETGLMEDGLLVWQWVKSHAPNANIYLWGHSLGSGATTYLTSNLTASGTSPAGILLDAPFTSVIDAAYHHPFSFPFWPVRDMFKAIALDFFHETHSSIDRVSSLSCPILIMHGHKDIIIPFHLGYQLYEVAVATRKPGDGKVEFIDCGDTGHKFNYRSKKLIQALDSFIQ